MRAILYMYTFIKEKKSGNNPHQPGPHFVIYHLQFSNLLMCNLTKHPFSNINTNK